MGYLFACGFECGVDNAAAHFNLAAGTGFSFDTGTVRSGSRSGRVLMSSSPCRVICNLAAQNKLVGRFYLRFATLPSGSTYIAHCGLTSSWIIGIAFNGSTGNLHCATDIDGFTSMPLTFAGPGFTPATGIWYRVDFKIDQTPHEKTVDCQITVDGDETSTVVLTQATSTQPGAADVFYIGSKTSLFSGEWFYDDLVLNDTTAVYPIGAGYVNHFIPTADGTHNIAGANQFERGTTGTDIVNATTTAYQLVDEVPMDTGSPDADDYVAAIAPANPTDYVEVLFGPAVGISTPTVGPRAVEVLVAHHEASASSGNIRLAVADNSVTDDVLNLTAVGSTSLQYARKHYAQPPSPTSEWNVATGNGNFNDLRMRFYSSDANPDQYWDGAMIEAEFRGSPAPVDTCTGELPAFETDVQAEIDALRALRDAGTAPEVYELAKVSWPSPTDTVYYAVLQTDDIASVAPPVSPIENRLIPDSNPDWFLPVQMDTTIGDEEVDLSFWDGDGAFSDLLVEHGEGIKVELFYWFPQVELLLPIWHGHLRQEADAEIDVCKIKAVQGFRSSDADLPSRAHWQECQAIFGGVFDTQAEIDENDCPYNKHIGGSVGVDGFTSCPRRVRQDCIDRLGNNANFMLSHATVSSIVANNQTHGPRLYSTSFGNETNLKEPVRVIMGARRVYGMPPLVYRRDANNNDPDHGFFTAEYELCEGPIESIETPRIEVGSVTQDADPFHYGQRLGTQGQSAVYPTLTVHSYSSTALIRYTFGWVNPADVEPSSASASAFISGLNDIRVYSDDDTYAETYTNNRAWQIAKMLTDKRWGYGYDYERLNIRSFIEAACWAAKSVRFTDTFGDEFDHIRSLSNVELTGRKVQQQIEDICMAGNLSRPFLFNGKIHIVPLKALTVEELAAAPVFTDEGINRNIIWDGDKTTLTRSRISDLDLPNRIECTFDDADNDYLETPARPVEDVDAQLRAGRVVGDNSRKTNVKKYPLLGVTVNAQAIKMEWSLLDLGPFHEGGLQNNLRLKFKIWFMESLELYPTKVIKVTSSQITRYGFTYFRVVSLKRLGSLEVELVVQAYPEDYMATFEEVLGVPVDPPPADPPTPPPFVLEFGDITYSGGILSIPIGASG